MRVIPIVIPIYNNFDITYKCIDSIKKYTKLPHKIVIVNDGSERKFVYRLADEIINNEKNLGFTSSINVGIKSLKLNYDYVVLMNNDIEVTENWLESLIETAKTDKKISIIGAKAVDENNNPSSFGATDLFGGLSVKGTLIGGKAVEEKNDPFMNKIRDVIFTSFYGVMITKEVIENIGLLDERFKLWCSDSDYCITALSRGYRVVVDPNCRMKHLTNASVGVNAEALKKDQKQLLYKWFGGLANELLSTYPLDYNKGVFAACGLVFKNAEGKTIKPEDTGIGVLEDLK